MRRFFCSLLMLLVVIGSYAQSEVGDGGRFYRMLSDSLRYAGNIAPGRPQLEKDTLSLIDALANPRAKIYEMQWMGQPAYSTMPPSVGLSAGVPVVGWGSGAVAGNVGSAYMPGLMAVNSGSLGVVQTLGSASLYVGGIVNKFGYYFGGVTRQMGVCGRFSYAVSPQVCLTAFGTYYFGKPPVTPGSGLPLQPAIVGFYPTSHFGGYADFKINEHWGVDVGGRTVQRFGTNRYDFEPIANPYYLMNLGGKKVKLSLPVGQILYHIIRSR